VQIDHGGGDLLVTEQLLDRVQMGARFQHVGGEAVTKRVDGGGGEVEQGGG
jgi:hypothetical protein